MTDNTQQNASCGLFTLNAHLDWIEGTYNKVTIQKFSH